MFDQLISHATLRAAFERVRENSGCRGADGVTVQRFAADLDARLDHLQSSLIRGCYRPFPLLRFAIPKPAGGVRYLTVPTVRDRVAQTAADLVTREPLEAQFEDTSHAFRRGRGVRSAVARIDALRTQGFGWVLDADVDGFFETIPHAPLLERLAMLGLDPRVNALFEAWIAAEEYDGKAVRRRTCGLPQGSVVSPLLANLFLDEFDEELARRRGPAPRLRTNEELDVPDLGLTIRLRRVRVPAPRPRWRGLRPAGPQEQPARRRRPAARFPPDRGRPQRGSPGGGAGRRPRRAALRGCGLAPGGA